jgi:CheY-like chemotaxis protein
MTIPSRMRGADSNRETMTAGPTLPSRRILILEDDVDGLDALRILVESHGYVVDVARTAAAAVERARAHRPEAVILDLNVADAPACEAIPRLRAAVGAATRLIVFSGAHRLEPVARASGCDAFVLKPDVEGLQRVLGVPEVVSTPPLSKIVG